MDKKLQLKLEEASRSVGASVPAGGTEYAQIITRSTEGPALSLGFLRSIIDTVVVKPGDTWEYTRPLTATGRNTLPVRQFVAGSRHLVDANFVGGKRLSVTRDTMIAKTGEYVNLIRSNPATSAVTMRDLLRRSLVEGFVSRILNAFDTVWDGTTPNTNFFDASVTGLTLEVLVNMIQTVNITAGGVRAIVGTRQSLSPAYESMGVVEVNPQVVKNTNGVIGIQSILTEYLNTGRVLSYQGIPIIELEVPRDPVTLQPTIRTDRVYVVGNSIGKAYLQETPETQEHLDTSVEPAYYTLAMWTDYGAVFDNLGGLGVIRTEPEAAPMYRVP